MVASWRQKWVWCFKGEMASKLTVNRVVANRGRLQHIFAPPTRDAFIPRSRARDGYGGRWWRFNGYSLDWLLVDPIYLFLALVSPNLDLMEIQFDGQPDFFIFFLNFHRPS
ncbi:hypothetical protein ACOSP7_000755 [Xanthoceras sorbifolium]